MRRRELVFQAWKEAERSTDESYRGQRKIQCGPRTQPPPLATQRGFWTHALHHAPGSVTLCSTPTMGLERVRHTPFVAGAEQAPGGGAGLAAATTRDIAVPTSALMREDEELPSSPLWQA